MGAAAAATNRPAELAGVEALEVALERDKAVDMERAEATTRTEEMKTGAAGEVTARPLTRSRTRTRIAAGSARTATHTPICANTFPFVTAGLGT